MMGAQPLPISITQVVRSRVGIKDHRGVRLGIPAGFHSAYGCLKGCASDGRSASTPSI